MVLEAIIEKIERFKLMRFIELAHLMDTLNKTQDGNGNLGF